MARRNSQRASAGAILPRGLHIAKAAGADRTTESGAGIRPAVPGGIRDAADHCCGPEAAGGAHWFPCGAAYVESTTDAEPSLMMPGIIIYLIFNEQLRLVFRATPL